VCEGERIFAPFAPARPRVAPGAGRPKRAAHNALPDGWDGFSHPEATKCIGTRWLEEERSVVLEVPTAVIPVAKNYLVNPFHPDFPALACGEPKPFNWDSRLFRRTSGNAEEGA
jgi:hypothetical protein